MDLHQKEIQGFFSFPVDNLRASPFLIQYIQEEVINPSEYLLHVIKYGCCEPHLYTNSVNQSINQSIW